MTVHTVVCMLRSFHSRLSIRRPSPLCIVLHANSPLSEGKCSLGHVSHDLSVLPVRAGLQEGMRRKQQVKAPSGLQQLEVEQHVLAPACRKLAEGLVHAVSCYAGGLAAPLRVIDVYSHAVLAAGLHSLAGMAGLHMQKPAGDTIVPLERYERYWHNHTCR